MCVCVYIYIYVYIYTTSFFIRSSVGGHLGCVHILAIISSALMNMGCTDLLSLSFLTSIISVKMVKRVNKVTFDLEEKNIFQVTDCSKMSYQLTALIPVLKLQIPVFGFQCRGLLFHYFKSIYV